MSTTQQIIPQDTKNDKLLSRLAALAGWLVGALAVLAFVLSYASLRHLAEANGTGWTLSWVWPLLLDFAMVVFSLAILRGNLRGERTWYPWTLTVIYAGLATVANVLDVMTLGLPPAVIAAAVKAIAPLTLVLAFELLMQMVRAEVKRSALIVRTADLRAEQDALTARIDAAKRSSGHWFDLEAFIGVDTAKTSREWLILRDLIWQRDNKLCRKCHKDLTDDTFHCHHIIPESRGGTGEPINLVTLCPECHAKVHDVPLQVSFRDNNFEAANEARQIEMADRREKVLELIYNGLSTRDLAAELGVSPATIRRDRQALNGQVRG